MTLPGHYLFHGDGGHARHVLKNTSGASATGPAASSLIGRGGAIAAGPAASSLIRHSGGAAPESRRPEVIKNRMNP